MKILIVSYLFAPNNEIGSVRSTKIAKYLLKRGMTVDVISYGYKSNNSMEIPKGIRNYYFMNKEPICSNSPQKNQTRSKWKGKFASALRRFYRNFLTIKQSKCFVNFCIETYKKNKEKYDVLFTSFGPISSLICGLKIKKINPSVTWICDFRDPLITMDTSIFFKPYFNFLQNKACKLSNGITVVSKGFLKRICKKKYLYKAKFIPNAFDKDDYVYPDNRQTDTLNFTYTGSLYEGKRTLFPLFEAISDLTEKKLINKSKIKFHYAGFDFDFLEKEASKYNLSDILINHSFLSRSECLKLETNSDILVLSTWNKKKEFGVLPGKFLEYLLFNIPILCIVDGKEKNSEISLIIDSGNLGCSIEISDYSNQYNELLSFVLFRYNVAVNNYQDSYFPSKEVIDYYSYENTIDVLINFINFCMHGAKI